MAGHGGMQADKVLENELRVLHLDCRQQKGTMYYTRCGLSMLNLKEHIKPSQRLQKATASTTRSHPIIVPLTMGQAIKHMNL